MNRTLDALVPVGEFLPPVRTGLETLFGRIGVWRDPGALDVMALASQPATQQEKDGALDA